MVNRHPLNTDTHKWCPRCQTLKERTKFGKNRTAYDGIQSICKPCSVIEVLKRNHSNPEAHAAYNREWSKKNPERKADIALKTRLGLPHGSYQKMYDEQKGFCAICEGIPKDGRRLHVDHCARTGKVRALLCGPCNTGIGQLQHDKDILRKAIEYLDKHS